MQAWNVTYLLIYTCGEGVPTDRRTKGQRVALRSFFLCERRAGPRGKKSSDTQWVKFKKKIIYLIGPYFGYTCLQLFHWLLAKALFTLLGIFLK